LVDSPQTDGGHCVQIDPQLATLNCATHCGMLYELFISHRNIRTLYRRYRLS